jgi:hypothetical protein
MFLAKDINYDTLQPLEYLASKCLNSDCVTLDLPHPLPVGEYVVLVEVDWSSTVGDKDRKYVLQAYTHSASLDLSLAPQTPHFDYLAETLKSLAKLKTIRKTYQDKGHEEVFRCMSITDSLAEYGYLYYQNDGGRNNGAILKETIIFNKLENFSIVLEDGDKTTRVETIQNANTLPVLRKEESKVMLNRNPSPQGYSLTAYQVHVTVPPGQSVLIILKRTDRQASYQVTYYSTLMYPEENYV